MEDDIGVRIGVREWSTKMVYEHGVGGLLIYWCVQLEVEVRSSGGDD